MPPRKAHPAKGWAGTLDRSSMVRRDIKQDTHYNQDRLNNETLRVYGLQLKPDYRFSEPGVSASKPITRKELDKGIRAVVVEKAVEALVLQDVSRLSRLGMRHVGEMLDAVDAVGGRIIFHRGNLDSSKPQNRAIIAFLAEQAREETETLAWRIGNWHEGCRVQGKWVGQRPYGYNVIDGKLVPREDEAPVVRRIVSEFLAGRSCRQIAAALNKDGIPSPGVAKAPEFRARGRKGGKARPDATWGANAVRTILQNPALVGWRQHNHKVVVGPDGEPVSFGEGICKPGDRARILGEFDRRSTIVRNGIDLARVGGKTGGGRPAGSLLVGIAVCGSCGYAMMSHVDVANSRGRSERRERYRCSSMTVGYSCPARAHIMREEADQEVLRQVTTRLAAMEPDDPILDAVADRWRELMLPDDESDRAVLNSRLDAVRGRIVDLEEARYVRGEFVTPDEVARWETMMERLKVQRDALSSELDKLGPPPEFDLSILLDAYQSRQTWEAAPMAQRRELLKIAVDKVTILPARHLRGIPPDQRIKVLLASEVEDAEPLSEPTAPPEPPPEGWPLAELVANQRLKLRLSQRELAQRMRDAAQAEGAHCAIARSKISMIERGHRTPYPDTLGWLAAALELPVDLLTTAAMQQRLKQEPPDESSVHA